MSELIKLSRPGYTRKYFVNKDVFLDETALSFYLLGVFCTDGNINDKKHHLSFSVDSVDKNWIEEIRNILCPNKPLEIKRNCFSIRMSDIDSMNWLIAWGCTPRKTYTLKLEKEIPEKYFRDFLRGAIDGDGSINESSYVKIKRGKKYKYKKRVIYLVSVSEMFIKQVKDRIPKNINCIVTNMGKKNSTIRGREIIATTDMFKLCFNDSNAIKLVNYLYYDDNILCLNRKKEIALNWLSEYTIREKKIYKCKCGKNIKKKSKNCIKCAGKKKEKIIWPNDNDFFIMVKNFGYTEIGEKLGVSKVAVFKRYKKINIGS